MIPVTVLMKMKRGTVTNYFALSDWMKEEAKQGKNKAR